MLAGLAARRGAEIAFQNSFRLRLAMPDGEVRSYLYTVNTVGATAYVGEPRLLVSLLEPLGFEVREAANGQDHAGHPGGEGGADPRTPTVPPRLGTSRSRPPL